MVAALRERALRRVAALFIVLVIASGSLAETLKEVVLANHLPLTAFASAQLRQPVDAFIDRTEKVTLFAYRIRKGDSMEGSLHVVRFNQPGRSITRRDIDIQQEASCAGSILNISLAGGFVLIATDINPSAECLLVLDGNLKVTERLYGFDPVEVLPGQIVITENTRHFAAVHPERLQLVDLRNKQAAELYPPLGDPLRTDLAEQNLKHMPSAEICVQTNDPCRADQFDEEAGSVMTDGSGRFAFIATQSASHTNKEHEDPNLVASQMVLYVYGKVLDRWNYCEEKLETSEAEKLGESLKSQFRTEIVRRCTPNIPVVPDLSTADSNPFLNH